MSFDLRLKIVIVTYELLPQTGTSARTLGFVRALTSRGHEVKVLGPLALDEREALVVKLLDSEYLGALPIVCKPGVMRSFIFAVNLVNVLRTLHRKFPFEIVH